ncbi:MAG: hypothetical protein JW793_14325 [Acidobacteria bacterium]|nr:hypothetical protein [Acidobacteriota bacterium]
MSKLPSFQFDPDDWLTDPCLSLCKPATRGVWIDLLCAIRKLGLAGQLCGTTEQLARIARCQPAELADALTDLQATGAADVSERNGIATVVSRRMKREAKEREMWRLRQSRKRAHADVTDMSRPCHKDPDDMRHVVYLSSSVNNNKKQKKHIVASEEARQLAAALRNAIKVRDKNAKAAHTENLLQWAHDIDLLLRIDRRSPDEVGAVIAWCQKPGCFWGPNILSGRKLRDKFDTLIGQMQRDGTGGNNAADSRNPGERRGPFGEPEFNPAEIPPWAGPPE